MSTLALGDLSIDEPMLFPGAECSSPLPPSVPSTGSAASDAPLDDDAPLSMTAPKSDDQSYSSFQMGEVIDDSSISASATPIQSAQQIRAGAKLARELTPLNLPEGK